MTDQEKLANLKKQKTIAIPLVIILTIIFAYELPLEMESLGLRGHASISFIALGFSCLWLGKILEKITKLKNKLNSNK